MEENNSGGEDVAALQAPRLIHASTPHHDRTFPLATTMKELIVLLDADAKSVVRVVERKKEQCSMLCALMHFTRTRVISFEYFSRL